MEPTVSTWASASSSLCRSLSHETWSDGYKGTKHCHFSTHTDLLYALTPSPLSLASALSHSLYISLLFASLFLFLSPLPSPYPPPSLVGIFHHHRFWWTPDDKLTKHKENFNSSTHLKKRALEEEVFPRVQVNRRGCEWDLPKIMKS